MRLFCSPPQMQGSFFRHSPSRLSSSLRSSVGHRISWYHQAASWSDSLSSKTLNPSSRVTPAHPPDPTPRSVLPLPSSSSSAPRAEQYRQDDANGSFPDDRFRSVGARSDPSRPSIPGKYSKYSKPISKLYTESIQRRKSEKRDKKAFRKPMGDVAASPDRNVARPDESSPSESGEGVVTKAIRKDGKSPLSASKMPDWMQQYQFSYSEVPTAPIIGFRQTPWSPFGPEDLLDRPWTGSAPLKPTKKKLPVFDSFQPPPPGKKGVKYVQPPGPFPPGQKPRPGKTREEILGDPLTPLEIQELVNGVNKRNKQVNLGRDGLTHNMLDVIHSHWKRSVCCKIKCKGVPTLDMNNVCRVVEEKTGGVVVQRAGGVMYVFRGRNYNYKDRPQIPIMLWKPPDPIYPRLIQPVPEGLTEQEAKRLRGVGRKVAPLCRLAKNGVYLNLVEEVKAQLEIDEVVRVDCQGMHATDYKKIGAKLKDLVPCTLLSFEKEQIIMCRKRPPIVEDVPQTQEVEGPSDVPVDGGGLTSDSGATSDIRSTSDVGALVMEESVAKAENYEHDLVVAEAIDSTASQLSEMAIAADSLQVATGSAVGDSQNQSIISDEIFRVSVLDVDFDRSTTALGTEVSALDEVLAGSEYTEELISVTDETLAPSSSDRIAQVTEASSTASADNVEDLWQRAIEEGKAYQLDSQGLDPDAAFEKATELSVIQDQEEAVREAARLAEALEENRKQPIEKTSPPATSPFEDVPPMGGLAVDQLAKLLGP